MSACSISSDKKKIQELCEKMFIDSNMEPYMEHFFGSAFKNDLDKMKDVVFIKDILTLLETFHASKNPDRVDILVNEMMIRVSAMMVRIFG